MNLIKNNKLTSIIFIMWMITAIGCGEKPAPRLPTLKEMTYLLNEPYRQGKRNWYWDDSLKHVTLDMGVIQMQKSSK